MGKYKSLLSLYANSKARINALTHDSKFSDFTRDDWEEYIFLRRNIETLLVRLEAEKNVSYSPVDDFYAVLKKILCFISGEKPLYLNPKTHILQLPYEKDSEFSPLWLLTPDELLSVPNNKSEILINIRTGERRLWGPEITIEDIEPYPCIYKGGILHLTSWSLYFPALMGS